MKTGEYEKNGYSYSCHHCQAFRILSSILTIMVNAIDKSHSYLGMVISHEHNIKELLVIWVELTKSAVDLLQCLLAANGRTCMSSVIGLHQSCY